MYTEDNVLDKAEEVKVHHPDGLRNKVLSLCVGLVVTDVFG